MATRPRSEYACACERTFWFRVGTAIDLHPFTGDETMRLLSLPSSKTWCVRLTVVIAVVQVGMFSAVSLAKGHKGVPIKGRLEAVELFDVQFPTLFVDGGGSGNASHLGHFTVTYESEVYIPTLTGSGSAHFIAANGDSLITEVTGQANPTENPDVLSIVETFTIVGGTGRFDGASGVFTVERLLNAVTGVTYGSLDGTIVK
jgi:hypothetical protein